MMDALHSRPPLPGYLALAIVALASSLPTATTAACTGAKPAIVSARVTGTTPDGSLTRYEVTVAVKNAGSQNQSAKVLQSVAIVEDDVKVDQKGIPPLAAGQSYTFPYSFVRASDAGTGTTKLDLQLSGDSTACSGPGNTYTLTI